MALGFALALAVVSPAGAAPKKSPNVVLILADDMGIGDPGCYNKASKIPTPHLDRLAAQGMRFTDAHSPSAVCTPTRYGILTGRYCWRTRLKRGVLQGYDPLLIEPGRLTVPGLLKKHGYATACIGKWHLGLGKGRKTDYRRLLKPGPRSLGFDRFFGIPASLDMPPYVFVDNERPVEAPTKEVPASTARRHENGWFYRGGASAPGFQHAEVLPALTKQALAFLEAQAKAKDRRFFLYFALTAPHTPLVPSPAFRGKSKLGAYGDFTMQVDAVVGQVMSALRRLKLRDNTLILFTSDNGAPWTRADVRKYGHRANGPWRGQKADIWDGGHRIPLLACWPGRVKPRTTCDQTVCLTDLLATCAALVGADLPDGAGEDSFSLLPALRGERPRKLARPAVVHHSADGMFAIRQGDWKWIDGLGSGGFSVPGRVKPRPGGPAGQLYDLAKDPGEEMNLYGKHPEVVKRLKAMLERYRRDGRSRPKAKE
jgi:arylsulfatase A-like enzyme